MVFKINGVDMLPYVAHQGIKWQRGDIDASDAGRALDGSLRRNRVATKMRLDITCRPLTTTEAQIVLQAIAPEWVLVEYTDPMLGHRYDVSMYANNNPASHMLVKDGQDYWDGITFPLIER